MADVLVPGGGIRYRVSHRTTYEYSGEVVDGYSVANVKPRPTPRQTVLIARVASDPEPDEFEERIDVFGNHVVQLGVHRLHGRFEVVAESEVDVRPHRLPDTSPSWHEVVATTADLGGAPTLAVSPYLSRSPLIEAGDRWQTLLNLFDPDFEAGRSILDAATAVCHRIFEGFEFDPLSTDVSTPLATVIDQRGGVCQDFAHLAIAVFRQRGIAARYVSGYIETDPPPGEPKSIGADASHAWCAIWVPEIGWVDLDPTNDQLPTTRHVTVAWGRDYADVAPVRGVVIGPTSTQHLDVAVDVTRIPPSTRAGSPTW